MGKPTQGLDTTGVKDAQLALALRKLVHNGGREWAGCLTPSEILAVVADGAKPVRPADVSKAHDRATVGHSEPWWFYCTPPQRRIKPVREGHYAAKRSKRNT